MHMYVMKVSHLQNKDKQILTKRTQNWDKIRLPKTPKLQKLNVKFYSIISTFLSIHFDKNYTREFGKIKLLL